MKEAEFTLREIVLIALTRAMGGAGVALLLGDRLSEDHRKAVGWTLFLIGCASTIPLAIDVLRKRR
jgi:ABC-type tungstate transport system substrate-binding protein